MLIYGAPVSPYVRKVLVVAAEKGLAYDLRLTSPNSPDPEFRAASPFGKIPAMRQGDFTLADSSAIVAWMEAEYPAHPLLPAPPRQRARAVWFDEYADTLLGAAVLKVLFNRFVSPKFLKQPGNEAIAAQGEAELAPLLEWLEGQCPEAASPSWLLGEDFSLADVAVAAMLRSLTYVNLAPTAQGWPKIAAWYARVAARPAWQLVEDRHAPRRPG